MKKMLSLVLSLLLLSCSAALADNDYLNRSSLPQNSQQTAEDAFKAHLPSAVLNYIILDHDDKRFEWEIYFSNNGSLGVCEIDAVSGAVLRTKEYPEVPAGSLTADAAVKALEDAKGKLTVLELDFERDDGHLRYEGEAELDGRFYEFEMTVEGRIVEWERD